MGKIEIILPAMGEGIIEATITKWLVKEGDRVDIDEPVLEVATDKVDSEIYASVSGIISRIIYKEGEIPKVGEVLAIIESKEINESSSGLPHNIVSPIAEPKLPEKVLEDTELQTPIVARQKADLSAAKGSEDLISPFVRFLAKNREISFNELIQIKGSGLNGRITREDLHSYILKGRPFRKMNTIPFLPNENGNGITGPTSTEKIVPGAGEELIEMDRTRKLIAAHMVRSKRTSPHVTSMVEIDITNLVQWRAKNKDNFYKKHGIKLTFTPIFVFAVVKALKDFPGINISVAGDYIIRKKYINIGVATALPDGNLIVPVIKDADKRSFVNIALHLTDLAERARNGQLEHSEVKGGTFTVTNMGQYDNVSGTPIINQPEVAILAVGAIKKKPGVVKIGNELSIGIRDIMVLSLTYDHRVLDGAIGGSFVKAIGNYLEGTIPDF